MLNPNRLRIISRLCFCIIFLCAINAQSEKRLCGDPGCQKVISWAKAIYTYRSNSEHKVSFERNSEIKVLSKGTGKDNLWYIEVNDRRGYAPKDFIQEYRNVPRGELIEVDVSPIKKTIEEIPAPKPTNISTENHNNFTSSATVVKQEHLETTVHKGEEYENSEANIKEGQTLPEENEKKKETLTLKSSNNSSPLVSEADENKNVEHTNVQQDPVPVGDNRDQINYSKEEPVEIQKDKEFPEATKASEDDDEMMNEVLEMVLNNMGKSPNNPITSNEKQVNLHANNPENKVNAIAIGSEGQTDTEEKNITEAKENNSNGLNNSEETKLQGSTSLQNSSENVNNTIKLPQAINGSAPPQELHQTPKQNNYSQQKRPVEDNNNKSNSTAAKEVFENDNNTTIKESVQSNKGKTKENLTEEDQLKDKEKLNSTEKQNENNPENNEIINHVPDKSLAEGLERSENDKSEVSVTKGTPLSSENAGGSNRSGDNKNEDNTKVNMETMKLSSPSNKTTANPINATNTHKSLKNASDNSLNTEDIVKPEEIGSIKKEEDFTDENSLSFKSGKAENTNKTMQTQSTNNNIETPTTSNYSENPVHEHHSVPSDNAEKETVNNANVVSDDSGNNSRSGASNETIDDKKLVDSSMKSITPNIPLITRTSGNAADNIESTNVPKENFEQTSNINTSTERNSQSSSETQENLNSDQKQKHLNTLELHNNNSYLQPNTSDINPTTTTTTAPEVQTQGENSDLKYIEDHAYHNANEMTESPLDRSYIDDNKYIHNKSTNQQTDEGNSDTDIYYKAEHDRSIDYDTLAQTTDSDLSTSHHQPTTEIHHYEDFTPPYKDEFHTEPTPNPLAYVSSSTPSPSSSLPPPTSLPSPDPIIQHQGGLFDTIRGTVNSFISNDKSEKIKRNFNADQTERIQRVVATNAEDETQGFCERPEPNMACPKSDSSSDSFVNRNPVSFMNFPWDISKTSIEKFTDDAVKKILDMSDMIVCLIITAISTLIFIFGYYCFCSNNKESELLSKLNYLERNLLAANKENIILKHDLTDIRNKLSSIEDNSFGSNEMVMSLKKDIEAEVAEKQKLQEQVANLEKELENAAEAGLELNKIVSELLSNQTGEESIISSVEELQKQLNEQQNTILEINANLAEKSRENSELQLMIAEQHARLSREVTSLQQDNDELEAEKSNLKTQLGEVKTEFEKDITKALEGKNLEIQRLQTEIVELKTSCEEKHAKWQTCLAKIEALEECLKSLKKDSKLNIKDIIDAANIKAEIIDLKKQKMSFKELLEAEKDARNLLEEQIKMFSAETEKLKHNFHQSEKDKLEAQTRLEVLSNYFKEKETQLQKELSLKEAMWLKQQGEKTSTVDRLTSMQAEIQALKSQNDSLRAEIEAQVAAHKAQTGTLENRAHETWLAARQSERRYEEARAEATALRRKLTALAGLNGNEINADTKQATEQRKAPSPNSVVNPLETLEPALGGRIPPPPTFLPPPFMGPVSVPVPPFMRMPPPPFMAPGTLPPPPLGRLMSPPLPPPGAKTHSNNLRSRRYTPSDQDDFDNYDDDDDDDVDNDDDDDDGGDDDNDNFDDDDENEISRHTHGGYRWPSPVLGPYRSYSPSGSRYSRDAMDRYDFRSETDYSPPLSPRDHHTRRSHSGSFRTYSPPPTASSPISDTSRKGKIIKNKGGSRFVQNVYRKDNSSSDSESASGNSEKYPNTKRVYKRINFNKTENAVTK